MRTTVHLSFAILALAGLGPAAPLASQPAEDLRTLASQNMAAPRHDVVYHVRAVSPELTRCLDMTLTREGTRSRTSASRATFPCEGEYAGLPPRDQFPEAMWTRSAFVALAGMSPAGQVSALEPEVIAEREARCFRIVDGPLSATLCLDRETGVPLRIEAARGPTQLTMQAARILFPR